MLQGRKQTKQNGNGTPAALIKVVAALVHRQSGPGALPGICSPVLAFSGTGVCMDIYICLVWFLSLFP